MSLSLGNAIAVSTNFIKSNPAVPVYKGEEIAKQYCESKNIPNDEQLEIALLDNEEAENFLEKVFNNMKVIRGLITKKD